MLTKILIVESIDSGSIAGGIEELAELAKLNKVLLGFLRRVGYEGPLRVRGEGLYERFIVGASRVSGALRGLDCALFR